MSLTRIRLKQILHQQNITVEEIKLLENLVDQFFSVVDQSMPSFIRKTNDIYNIGNLSRMASFIMEQLTLQKITSINIKQIDIFVDFLLKEISLTTTELKTTSVLTITSFMENDLSKSCKTLIENVDINIINIDEPIILSNVQYDYLSMSSLLCLAMEKQFSECINILLNKTKNINVMSSCGITPLYLSLMRENKPMARTLLAQKDIQISGHCDGNHIFDLLRIIKDKNLTEVCIQKLHATFSAENYDWKTPIYFPIALLTTKQQNKLKEKLLKKIEKISIFSANLNLKNELLQFINDPTPLPFKLMNRLSIAFEMVIYLLHPEWIKQGHSNLCGPATLMQHLVAHNQKSFIKSVIEIAELNSKKPKHLPKVVKQISVSTMENAILLSELWLETIRNAYNIFTGYNTDSQFEAFTGSTTPYQFEKMFADFGYQIFTENMQIKFANDSRAANFFEKIRIGLFESYGRLPSPCKIYGEHHQNQQSDIDRFNSLCQWTSSHNEMVPVLLSGKLINQVLNLQGKTYNQFYLLEASHFCNLKNFINLGNYVKFDIVTYGKEAPVLIDKDEFMQGFLGGLMVEIKPLISTPTLQRP